MTDTSDIARLLQEIVAGRVDEHLDDIAAAVAARVKDSMFTFSWRFRLDGVDVGELEVTLDEWSEIQRDAGVHLAALVPEVNVDHLLALGRVLLRTRGGLSADDAAARIGGLGPADIPNIVSREVLEAPFGTGAPTSS